MKILGNTISFCGIKLNKSDVDICKSHGLSPSSSTQSGDKIINASERMVDVEIKAEEHVPPVVVSDRRVGFGRSI